MSDAEFTLIIWLGVLALFAAPSVLNLTRHAIRHARWVWRQRRRRRVGIVVVPDGSRETEVLWGEPVRGADLDNRWGAPAVPVGMTRLADVLSRPKRDVDVGWRL